MKKIGLFLFSLFAASSLADDIAFGTVKGIKVYDQSGSKVTRIVFSGDATHQNEGCNGVATLTHSLRSEEALNQMLSIALAAYMGQKKIRAYSNNGTCEADLLALQNSRF